MKNILGKNEDLKLFNDKGKKVYEYYAYSDGACCEYTFDEKGNELTYKNSDGYWYERTCDENGNRLTYKNSDGYWSECTYDDKGNLLTYKDSHSITIGFDIPEYTMEELVNKLGNFKIKK
jgi:hypothetical protein